MTTPPKDEIAELREKLVKLWYSAYRAGQRHDDGPELNDVDGFMQLILSLKEKWQREARESAIDGNTSDGYHTFNELYDYRMAYNAALFNEWAAAGKYKVHKSWHHADAPYEPIFGGGWFIVMAELPTGQISNHYAAEHWDKFQVPEVPVAHAWDGHTPQQALQRLQALAAPNTNAEQKEEV